MGKAAQSTPAPTLEEQLDDAYRASVDCVHYVARLRKWADTDPPEWYGMNNADHCGPESYREFLKEAFSKASAAVPAAYRLFPVPDTAVAVGGIHATRYHVAAITLARRVLQAAADAVGSFLIEGLNPELNSYEARIPGLDCSVESIRTDERTGRVFATGERHLFELRDSDFRQRLQAMPQFDEAEFTASIALEFERAETQLSKQTERDGRPGRPATQ